MRLQLALLAALALPSLASAQSSAAAAGTVPPLPTIGLPLPHIGLPPPEQPAASQPSPRGVGHRGHRGQIGGRAPAIVYLIAPYPWLYEPEPVPAPPPPKPTGGCLRLDTDAAVDQQFFVDGIYIGTQDDFGQGGDEGIVPIEAGTHILQVMSSGYETVQVSLGVIAGRCTTYHVRLNPSADAPVETLAKPTPVAPMTGYLIPGCYLGNVPPERASLPADCDVSRAITIKP